MQIKFLPLLLTFAIFGCRDNQHSERVTTALPNWDIFYINVNGRSFRIPFNEDTCHFIQNLPDSAIKNLKQGEKNYTVDKVFIPKPEKDTILKLAIDAITKPVLTDQQVTCYAGHNVDLSLRYGRVTQINCSYSSVPGWTSISPTLKRISEMTFDKYGK